MKRLADLAEFGIDPAYLAEWRKRWNGDDLTPLQAAVLSDPAFLQELGPDLIVTGPAASGKTFVAEALIAYILSHNPSAQCFYLVPLRALVTEKTEAFRKIFGVANVVPASSDYREFEPVVSGRQFKICVAVYERFYSWLSDQKRLQQMTQDCALVVIDELQMLEIPERGDKLDLILTLLRAQRAIHIPGREHHMRFLGLAAYPEAAAPVVRWWHANHLDSRHRPIPLFRGAILFDHCLPLRSDDDPPVAPPELPSLDLHDLPKGSRKTEEIVRRLIFHYALEAGRKVLIFVPSKKYAQDLASRLARTVRTKRRLKTTTGLTTLEDTHARRMLAYSLPAGIAFHHGGLTTEERRLVEDRFSGDDPQHSIDVLVSTPTLGMGVNMPADVVLIVGVRQFVRTGMPPDDTAPDNDGDAPPTVEMTPIVYRNMVGRAGRNSRGTAPLGYGISLLIQDNYTKPDSIEHLLDAPCTPLTSALMCPSAGLEPHVLTAVAWMTPHSSKSPNDVTKLLSGTFAYGHSSEPQRQSWTASIVMALDQLIEHGYVERGNLDLLGMGKKAGGTGLSLSSLDSLRALLPSVPELVKSPFGLLYAITRIEELRYLYPWEKSFLSDEKRCQKVGSRVAQFVGRRLLLPIQFSVDLDGVRRGNPTYVCTLVRTLALWHWIGGSPVLKIEATGHCPGLTRGDLHWLSDRAAWLLDLIAEMWMAEEGPATSAREAHAVKEQLNDLARRVLYGVPDEVGRLAELRAPGWHRERLVLLAQRQGWTSNGRNERHPNPPLATAERLDDLISAMRRWRLLGRREHIKEQHKRRAAEVAPHVQGIDLIELISNAYAAEADEVRAAVARLLTLLPLDLSVTATIPREGIVELAISTPNELQFKVAVVTADPTEHLHWYESLDHWPLFAPEAADSRVIVSIEAFVQGCLEGLTQNDRATSLGYLLSGGQVRIMTAGEMTLLLNTSSAGAVAIAEQQPSWLQTLERLTGRGVATALNEALDKSNNVDAQLRAARLLTEHGALSEAVELQNRAIALAPHRLDLQADLAQLLDRQGRTQEAETILWKLQAEYPNSYFPLLWLGHHFARLRNYASGAAAAELALEFALALFKAKSLSAREVREVILEVIDLWILAGDRKMAANWAEKGLAAIGDDLKLREMATYGELTDEEWQGLQVGKMALTLVDTPGKNADALRAAETAITLFPKHWRGYMAKAQVLLRMRRSDEARAVWNQMLETDVPLVVKQKVKRLISSQISENTR